MGQDYTKYQMGDKVIWVSTEDHDNRTIHEGDVFWIARPSELGSYTTITSSVLKGWSSRKCSECVYAIEMGWDCWNVPKKYLSPLILDNICGTCVNDCKDKDIEECPFYEERIVEEKK